MYMQFSGIHHMKLYNQKQSFHSLKRIVRQSLGRKLLLHGSFMFPQAGLYDGGALDADQRQWLPIFFQRAAVLGD